MRIADFIHLINPGGYLGKSAAFEIGYAFAHSFKIFSFEKIINEMHKEFITDVLSPEEIIDNYKKILTSPNFRKSNKN